LALYRLTCNKLLNGLCSILKLLNLHQSDGFQWTQGWTKWDLDKGQISREEITMIAQLYNLIHTCLSSVICSQ
jgi:hypothetical protein